MQSYLFKVLIFVLAVSALVEAGYLANLESKLGFYNQAPDLPEAIAVKTTQVDSVTPTYSYQASLPENIVTTKSDWLCFDSDNDGFGLFCDQGSDCDDDDEKVHPNALEKPYDGTDNDCNTATSDDDLDGDGYFVVQDCDDGNADVYDTMVVYGDYDGDGYTNRKSKVVCGKQVPKGYAAKSKGADCNDRIATVFQDLTGYQDQDGDGYTSGNEMIICSGESLPSGYVASSLGADCDDSNTALNPASSVNCLSKGFFQWVDNFNNGEKQDQLSIKAVRNLLTKQKNRKELGSKHRQRTAVTPAR